MSRRLIIVTGPTASGKTDYAIYLALRLGSPVISCDSRQIYKEMTIGTAVPSASQLSAVKHYFIQTHTVRELYTAGTYEIEALELISRLFEQGHQTLVMCGGSGFYVDAVCRGLPEVPPADAELRASLTRRMQEEGVESLRLDLRRIDPEAYASIDITNPQRVLRALEVNLLSGRSFTSYRMEPRKRDFDIEKIVITRPRDVLYGRIDRRVTMMADAGLVEEAASLVPLRDYTALKTVGYKELFDYFDYRDGSDAAGLPHSVDEALDRIRLNTRHYAKRQITWWRRDPSARFVELQ